MRHYLFLLLAIFMVAGCAPPAPLSDTQGEFLKNANIQKIKVTRKAKVERKHLDNFTEFSGALKKALRQNVVGAGTGEKVGITVELAHINTAYNPLSTLLAGDNVSAHGLVKMWRYQPLDAAQQDPTIERLYNYKAGAPFAQGKFFVSKNMGNILASGLVRATLDKEEVLSNLIAAKVTAVIGAAKPIQHLPAFMYSDEELEKFK